MLINFCFCSSRPAPSASSPPALPLCHWRPTSAVYGYLGAGTKFPPHSWAFYEGGRSSAGIDSIKNTYLQTFVAASLTHSRMTMGSNWNSGWRCHSLEDAYRCLTGGSGLGFAATHSALGVAAWDGDIVTEQLCGICLPVISDIDSYFNIEHSKIVIQLPKYLITVRYYDDISLTSSWKETLRSARLARRWRHGSAERVTKTCFPCLASCTAPLSSSGSVYHRYDHGAATLKVAPANNRSRKL